MKRHAVFKLLEWKNNPHHEPLLIQGADRLEKPG